MDLQHRFQVPTPVGETWAHFTDIASVAECFPGATVTSVADDTFKGTVKVKLGPIALVYAGSGTFVERDEDAHSFKVEAKGKDKRGNGTAGATVTLTMADAAGATDVEVLTDLNVTGKPAQFGRGVMQDVSDKLLGQFVACLEERLSAGGAEETATAAEAATAATPAQPDPQAPEPASEEPSPETPAAAAPVPDPDAPTSSAAAGSSRPSSARQDDALDLGSTVLPVLVKSYWKPAAGVVAVLVVLWWILGRN